MAAKEPTGARKPGGKGQAFARGIGGIKGLTLAKGAVAKRLELAKGGSARGGKGKLRLR